MKPPLSLAGSVWLTLHSTLARLRQCIGAFGSLETSVPSGVVVVWVVAVGGLLGPCTLDVVPWPTSTSRAGVVDRWVADCP